MACIAHNSTCTTVYHGRHASLVLRGFLSEGPMVSSFSASLVIHVCQPCMRGCSTPSGGQVGGDSAKKQTKSVLVIDLINDWWFNMVHLEDVKRQLKVLGAWEGPKMSDFPLLFKMPMLPPVWTVYLSSLIVHIPHSYICLRFTEHLPIVHIHTHGQYNYTILYTYPIKCHRTYIYII